jgi:hypothetical protein
MGSSKNGPTKLGDLLIASGEISSEQLAAALEEQRNWGGFLGLTLIRLGYVDEHSVMRTLAEQLQLPVVQLHGKKVNAEVLQLVPVELAEKHRCLPLLVNGLGASKALYLGMEDPSDPSVLAEIAMQVGMKIQPVLVAQSELNEAIQNHYHWGEYRGGAFGSKMPEAQSAAASDSSHLDNSAKSEDPREDQAHSKTSEPVLEDLHEVDSADGSPRPFAAPSPLSGTSSGGVAAGGSNRSSDPMLQALAQLLVEKGVITRDELVGRLRTVLEPKSKS